MAPRILLAAALLAAAAAPALAGPRVEAHVIECRLDPAQSALHASDRLTVARESGGALLLHLNSHFSIERLRVDGADVKWQNAGSDGWIATYRVDIAPEGAPTATVDLVYGGRIGEAVKKSEDLGFVVGDDTRGVICEQGAYLTEGTGWYPSDGGLARFDVKAEVPEPYTVVTQGTPNATTGFWSGRFDSDGLALVAGKWKREERRTAAGVVIGTYLTEQNAAHAKLLLDAAEGSLRRYAELLGPYPYDRFDVVENWFTTGFGMPEFTLLGGDVIARMAAESQRLGMIPAGYLGHEIVHCWWGNSVFPDYATGNWCEGLTSYCANYMEKEAEGAAQALEWRMRNAVRFSIRATPERDYPVRAFKGKTEDVDDDIGYGKCAMFFHALRRDLGDEAFWTTLRRVAVEYRGKRASWDDWRREFEKTSKRNLAEVFAQALDRTGAPLFALSGAQVAADGGRLRVSATLVQRLAEGEAPWRVTVPVVVEHLEGVEETLVDCAGEETRFSVLVPSFPLRIVVDPDFHVFRRLAGDEIAPCLAATLARPQRVVVFPDGDEALAATAKMAAARSGAAAVAASAAGDAPKKGTSYLVFGDAARVPLLAALAPKLPRHFPSARAGEKTTVLASSRNPADPDEFVTTLVGAPAALAARARAVFYYQYDGRIVFEDRVPRERSQAWAVNHAARTLLPDVGAAASPANVRAFVDWLAAPERNGRLAGGPEEKAVRAAIAERLTLAGLEVDERPFSFTVKSPDPARPALTVGGAAVAGALPLVASPATEEPIALAGLANDPDGDLAGRALWVDLLPDHAEPLAFLRTTADMAKTRGALALVVRLPEAPSRAMTDLARFADETAAEPFPAHAAAGLAARTGALRELPLPAVLVPRAFVPPADGAVALDTAFTMRTVQSANVVARVKAQGKKRPGVVVLGAHYDHLGAGFPGADDNASGVAALVEAAGVLSAHADRLARDVVLVAFGAEEWGLRGARAFLAESGGEAVVAMINADTVGRRGVGEVNVVGVSKHPRLAKVVAAALEQSGLLVGPDIDRHAFAHGSDHWAFHEAGVPAVDLWSGDYGVMHTPRDTADGVDEAKVSRVGRAMALAAIGAAAGF